MLDFILSTILSARQLPWRRAGLLLPATLVAASISLSETSLQESSSQPARGLQVTSPLTLGSAARAQADWAAVEQEILAEQNRIRQNPQSYIPILEAYLASMDVEGNVPGGCGRNCTLVTREGRSAVEEAIAFLRGQAPVAPLEFSEGAARAAKSHAQDQQDGAIGHSGSDGSTPSQRLSRFGVDNLGSGENIAYGSNTARDVIMSLIVDDGVPDRGHRVSMFSPDWTVAGAGCGPHASIRSVCVINYAKARRATAGSSQLSVTNNGTVDLVSLEVDGADILGGALSPGQSRDISLSANQACETTLTIQLGGNYRPLDWAGLYLCDAAVTVDSRNRFMVQY